MSKLFAFAAGILLCSVSLFTTLHAFADEGDPTFSIVSKTPWILDSVSSTSVCGSVASKPNSRQCIGASPYEIFANDTISKLQSFVIGSNQLCGIDERGPRCWSTRGKFEKPLQAILREGDGKNAQLTDDRACLPQKDHTIRCYRIEQGTWIDSVPGNEKRDKYVRAIPQNEVFGPFADLRDFDAGENTLCALDGDRVICEPYKHGNGTPTVLPIPGATSYRGAKGISTNWNSVCVISDEGLDCTLGTDEKELVKYHLEGTWLKAVKLFRRGYNTICAVDAAETPMCVQLGNKENEFTDVTPTDLLKPDVRILKFKSEAESACALLENRTTQEKSFVCGSITSPLTPTPFGSDIVDFRVGTQATCVLNSKGIVSCFNGSQHMDSPLPEDGSPIKSSSRCRWNDSRFHCGEISNEIDFSDIAKVIANSEPEPSGYPCILYENRSGLRQVKCFGSSETLAKETPTIDGDVTKLASSFHYACVYGGPNTTCWGSPIGGENGGVLPNFSNVRRMAFGDYFGCASDDFGFVCWGARIEERNLTPPPGLGDLDSVRDFGVGNNHVCAISRENQVICWGMNDQQQTEVPPLTNPTSIVVKGNTNCASSDEGVTCWGYRDDSLLNKGQLSSNAATPF